MLAGRIDREDTMSRIELPQGEGPEVMRALALRPELAHAVSTYDKAVWNSSLDWRLHELVRMRVAQINECTVCLSWRSQPALDAGVDNDLLAGVDQWRDYADFTQAERVALEFAERYCTQSARIDDGLLVRLAEHFDPGEIVELTLVIAKYMAFGRFMQVLGLDQTCTLAFDEAGAVVSAS
jgi:AhpD family alkylhydroperoxidase